MELSYRAQYKNRDILLPGQLLQGPCLEQLRKEHPLILLPAVRYSAVLESCPHRTLDIFQEAVLRCLRTGETSLQVISEALALNLELVRRIAQDLEELGLTENGRCTNRGEKTLRGLTEDLVFSRQDLYYDALRGCLWEAVCEAGDLVVVNPPIGDKNKQGRSQYEHLTLGTVGSPVNKLAYYVHLPDSEGKTWHIPDRDAFSAADRLEAVRKAFRRREQFRWDWESKTGPDLEDVQAVELISSGIPCYVGALIIPEVGGWRVRHPFDGGECGDLRQALDERKDMPGCEELKKQIQNIWDNGKSAPSGAVWEFGGKKARALFSCPPEDVRLLELLSNALSGWQDLKNRRGDGSEAYKSRLEKYVNRCYEAVEHMLKEAARETLECIRAADPSYDPADFLTSDTALNSELLADLARSVGFREEEKRPFQRLFSYVPAVYLRCRRDMTVLVAKNLLMMKNAPKHPFWALLREERTDFLARIIWLKPLRDQAMHTYDVQFDFQEVEGFFRELLNWLLCFYPDARLDWDALDRAEGEMSQTGETPTESEALSSPEKRLDEMVGAVLHRFPKVRDLVLHVENLLRGDSPDLYKAVSTTYEHCWVWYVKQYMTPARKNELDGFSREYLDFCFRKLGDKGFSTQSEQLARWADSVKAKDVRRALKGGEEKASISVKLFLALYTAATSDMPELEQIAAQRPMLIEQAAASIWQRKHSSEDADPDPEKRREAAEELYRNLRAILNAFKSSLNS